MQNLKHTSTLPHIKSTNAELISKAILNIKAPTRKSISKYCAVTEMTACRAVARLEDAGFIQEKATKGQGPHAPASAIAIADHLSFIIIDLTLNEYDIYLLSSHHKILQKHSYTYNPSLDFPDNLAILLSRAKAAFSAKTNHFSGISVILNEGDFDKCSIQKTILDCLGTTATLILEISDCLNNLRESSVESHFPAENLYYLNLGKRNLAYFITEKFSIKSNPKILIDENGKRLEENLISCINAEQLYSIICSIINSASAILDAKLFLIESDRFILGNNMGFSVSKKLKLKFQNSRKILVSDSAPPFYIKGAAIALQKEIIKNILTK